MKSDTEFAQLSAIWIMASNDERSLMTYRGLKERLGLADEAAALALVKQHGELFRLDMPTSQLSAWKSQMLAGKQLPRWIRVLTGPERIRAIEGLSEHDGFRSQFRAEADSKKSEMAIIDWGLSHIERLRKAESEARDASAKRWQAWLPAVTSLIGAIVSLLVAFHGKK